MMISLRLLFIFAFSFVTAAAQETDSTGAVLRAVQKKYAGIDDASATFVQTMTRRFGKPATQSGTVMIKKGNCYKVVTPDQQIIADGKTVWIVSRSAHQVLIDAFKANTKVFSPDKFLLGLPDDFIPADMTTDSGLWKISLTPKRLDTQTRQILSLTAWINPQTMAIEKVEYLDRNKTRYSIVLSGLRFNQKLVDDEFRFDPPQGMKVVDLRTLK